MNEFEHDVQSKRNDFIDSGIGFIVAFVAFSAIFVIATIIDVVAH
ncbi:YqzM family protein [Sporosarcina sp. UB5]